MLTIVKLEDIAGEPKIKLDLPGPLRVGDPISLPRFCVERTTAEGRREVLEVDHRHCRFRVTAVGLDASSGPTRQLLTVQSVQSPPPTWKAVKKRPEGRRRLAPTVYPRTPV